MQGQPGTTVLPLPALCRHIRQQRVLLDMTQTELAKEAGVSQSLVAKLERGRLNPSYESVRSILEALERHHRVQEPTAAELMHKDPLAATPGERMSDVLARMKQHGISQLPVLDRKRPVGQVSEAVVLQRMEHGLSLDELKALRVREVMGPPMPSIGPETRRGVLVELLKGEPAALVVDQGEVVGVVTKPDLW